MAELDEVIIQLERAASALFHRPCRQEPKCFTQSERWPSTPRETAKLCAECLAYWQLCEATNGLRRVAAIEAMREEASTDAAND